MQQRRPSTVKNETEKKKMQIAGLSIIHSQLTKEKLAKANL